MEESARITGRITRNHVNVMVGDRLSGENAVVLENVETRRRKGSDGCLTHSRGGRVNGSERDGIEVEHSREMGVGAMSIDPRSY